MINSRIFGIVLVLGAVATPIFVVATSQNAIASILDEEADVDVAEAADSGNATAMMTNQTSDGNTTGVEFLSIQTAQSGSISEINATTSTLEMSNVSDSTILFSDRPDRIVSSVSTSDFIGNWTTGPNSFAADAPNAEPCYVYHFIYIVRQRFSLTIRVEVCLASTSTNRLICIT
jgi:hypothetical protein